MRLKRVIVGVLSDEAVDSYKRFSLVPFSERKPLFENIANVYSVVKQETLSDCENLGKYKPTYVVHGDTGGSEDIWLSPCGSRYPDWVIYKIF